MSLGRKLKNILKKGLQQFFIYKNCESKLKQLKKGYRHDALTQISLSALQKQQIDEFYVKNYGKKIPYGWHQYYYTFQNAFSPYYFPEHIYNSEFEAYMNIAFPYAIVAEDKNFLPIIAQAAGIKMPETIISCTKGVYKFNSLICTKTEAAKALDNCGLVFTKPSVDSYGGKDCRKLNMKDGLDTYSGKSSEAILDDLGMNFVIQECIHCHPSIEAIYPNSVNTFRVITYIWKDRIYIAPVIMRIGSGGSEVDNVSSGGMFVGVKNDGSLLKYAFTELKGKYELHPDTKIKFEGYKIPGFENVLKDAVRMHSYIPALGSVNWDFTIDSEGRPVLIEANVMGGSIDMLQIAHGVSPFEENTAEVLQWLQQMKNMDIEEQKKYRYGKMKY